MINRFNYEIWFLDHSEGKLNVSDEEMLFEFLDSNPDLREEFETFEIFRLEKEEYLFSGKNALKKPIIAEDIEGLDDFEILAVKKIEGTISKEETNILDSMLAASDKRQKELRAFELTRLSDGENLKYNKKSKLKRNSGIISLINKFSAGIAAAILLLVFFTAVFYPSPFEPDDSMVYSEKNDTPVSDKQETINEDLQKIPESNSKSIAINKKNKPGHHILEKKSEIKEVEFTNNQPRQDYVYEETKLPVKVLGLNTDVRFDYKNPEPVMYYNSIAANSSGNIDNNNDKSSYNVLTPKQFLIKKVKQGLEINDNNYTSLKPIDVVTSAIDKTKLAEVDYKKDDISDTREFALNIGSFSFSRKWTKE
ncbi:MAG: hypothetical protein ACM3PT_10685 [Deltaproteobacteria bacterium]